MSAWAAALALLAASAAPAWAAVPEGEFCVVGFGGSTGGAADGWLATVSRTGTVTPITLVPNPGLVNPWDCAIDPTNGDVIVVDQGTTGGGTDGAIYRVAVTGATGAVTTLAAGAPLVNPLGVHVTGDGTVLVGDVGASTGGASDGAAYALPVGGPLTRLDTPGVLQNPIDLDLDPRPFTGASAGLNAVIIEDRGGIVRRVPLATGTVQTIGSLGGNGWDAIEVGPFGKYFLTRDGNHVWRFDRDTGAGQQIASGGGDNLANPLGITVDYFSGDLFVADDNNGLIRVPPNRYLGGGPATSVFVAPGAFPGSNPAGVGFSPPLASTGPSARFGVPTRRAPIPAAPFTPIGPTTGTANGDTEFEVNLFIEVTDASSPLRIHVFDANSRDGYDEPRGGGFDSAVTYALRNPAGALVTSVTLAANARVDLDQRIATLVPGNLTVGGAGVTVPSPGLYRLTISTDTNDDINVFGVWVERFHAYTYHGVYGALDSFGSAPFTTPLDPARLHPYFERGCEYTLSNFDMDLRAGTSLDLTTREGQAFPLTLSGFTTHVEDTIDPTPAAAASRETDYGLQQLETVIATDVTPFANNNLVSVRAPDFQGWNDGGFVFDPLPVPAGNGTANPTPTLRTSPGPAFPQVIGPAANTFERLYLPRYDDTPGSVSWAGPAAPYAPYAMHAATPLAGDPPTVGLPSTYAVQITVVNPDPVNAMSGVTVTAPVPAPTLYVESGPNVSGAAVATGGGLVTTCGVAPCSGTLTATWASLAPGSAETFSYAVRVTPAAAAQRLYLTGGPALRGGGAAPAANAAPAPGTTVQFTPAWSGAGGFARTESLGPLCDLSVVEGTVTPVAVELARFDARAGDGEVLVVWETAAEFENLGFRLHRRLEGETDFTPVGPGLILGQGTSEFRALYAFHDRGLPNGVRAEYLLEDVEFDGDTGLHGPVTATPTAGAAALAPQPGDYDAFAAAALPGADEPAVAAGIPAVPAAAGPTALPLASAAAAGARPGADAPGAPPADVGGLRILDRGPHHLRVEISVPALEADALHRDGSEWTRVRAPGWDATTRPGWPELPARTFWLEAPDAAQVELTIEAREGGRLPLGAPVLPVASPVAEGGSATSALDPDPAAYLGATVWPVAALELAGSAPRPEGGRWLALRVQPARTRAGEAALETDTRIVARLDFSGPALLAAPAAASANALGVAALPAVKLTTRGRGLVAVDGAALIAAGLDPATDPRRLQMWSEGVAVPVRAEGELDGVLDPGDRVLWWAEGREDRYSDVEVFFLGEGAFPGLRAPTQAGLPAGPAPPVTVAARGRLEKQKTYLPGILNGEGDNFVGDYVFSAPVFQDVPTPGLAAQDAVLTVRLRGGTTWADIANDHHFTVSVGGTTVLDTVFDGGELFEASAPVPAALLSGDVTRVTVHPEMDSGAPFDLVYVDAVEIDYRRVPDLRSADAGRLVFAAEAGGPVAVGGLSDPANARVWDVTDPAAPEALGGVATSATDVAFETLAGRRYAVTDGGALRAPDAIGWNTPSDWTEPGAGHGADWLAIAHSSLVPELAPLVALRTSQGLSTAVVDVEDVYDERSGGRPTPQALQDFVRAALATWDPAPRYLVLVGDTTYDYRDFLKGASDELVPTMLVDTTFVEAASDTWLARADDADPAPDLAVGRLPVRTAAGLQQLVAKIVSYESSSPGGEAWRTRLLLVADDGLGAGDPVEGAAFEALLDSVEGHAPPDFEATRVALQDLPDATEGADANAAIRSALAQGVALGVYAGHGGARLWADELIFGASDFDTLANADWPLLVVLNCLNGFFDAPNEESLGEVALEAPDRGAIAVVASTTVSALAGQDAFAAALAERLLRSNVRRVGDAMLQSMASLATSPGAEDVLRTFVLLGDPATQLGMPRVPVADAGAPAQMNAGGSLWLDGSGSHDPEGGVLAFDWSVAAGPTGGDGVLVDSGDPMRPHFVASVPGVYTVALSVAAGGHTSAPATVRITVNHVGAAPLGCGPRAPGAGLAGLDLFYLALPLAASFGLGRRRRGSPPRT